MEVASELPLGLFEHALPRKLKPLVWLKFFARLINMQDKRFQIEMDCSVIVQALLRHDYRRVYWGHKSQEKGESIHVFLFVGDEELGMWALGYYCT
ncbi:hypothetical protein A2U01_0009456 [Trifolium medium]|uniref:Uncharacterized protein n=1 Tax=Trifolium medium TaxID=97028 RepID=A0A392MN87_9FABA|nr:hypothetical protein [Trifolium medium]